MTQPVRARGSAAVLGQPGRQVGRATEIEQRLGERLQLLQRQCLDAGGGLLAQGAAEQVELAERQFGFSAGFAFQAAARFSAS